MTDTTPRSPADRKLAPDVFAPATLGPVRLRNRTIKAATYEGMSKDNLVTDRLVNFHVEHAAGGVGMTTVAYCATSWEGRTDKHQIVWRPEAVPGLRRLTDAVHQEGAAVSAQVGHGGPVAAPKATGAPALSPSRIFHKTTLSFAQEATLADLERIVADHANAARLAVESGFDAIEVHLGHNYLASSFLSPKINKRADAYGGSLANRSRFAFEILEAVRKAAGGRIAIIAKLNMDDGVPGGFWLDEAITVARWMEESGTIDALELTAGSSLDNPMYLFKGDAPLREFAAVMPQPLKLGIQLVGSRVLRAYPYSDLYLLEDARQIRAAVSLPLVLLGGVTNRQNMDVAMAHGFDFVAMGRSLLREPDLINRIQADPDTRSLCNHNNKCMTTIYRGTHCVLIDSGSPRTDAHPAAPETIREAVAAVEESA